MSVTFLWEARYFHTCEHPAYANYCRLTAIEQLATHKQGGVPFSSIEYQKH